MKIKLLLMLILVSANGLAQYNVGKDKLAVEGYDVVAYFEDKAIPGTNEHTTTHQGIHYRFSNAGNLKTFNSNPHKYIPKYGGWCAYAMAETGEKVEINPKTFKVIDGRLYLFYNKFFNNTLEKWNKNEKELLPKADNNWLKIKK